MIALHLPFLANETLGTNPGISTYTSEVFAAGNYSLFALLVNVANAPSGTSPTLTFEVDQSNDQVTWTRIGAPLASITAAGVQVTPYAAGTTQGAVTQSFVRIQATLGGTNPVFSGVYADLLAQDV